MMRKHITRTLTRADIHAYGVEVVNGKPELVALPPITGWGKVTKDEAMKIVKSHLGKDASVTVTNIEYVDETYRIDIDTFVQNATKIESNTDENDEE